VKLLAGFYKNEVFIKIEKINNNNNNNNLLIK
jgi:hypothetical protein